jgi:hypothetical protein
MTICTTHEHVRDKGVALAYLGDRSQPQCGIIERIGNAAPLFGQLRDERNITNEPFQVVVVWNEWEGCGFSGVVNCERQ